MELFYPDKKTERSIISNTQSAILRLIEGDVRSKNKLIMGNNLPVMKAMLDEMAGTIDFVYIDPPFSTNTIFKSGKERTSHVSASTSDKVAYEDKLKGAEFIEFIRERLIFIRELMADHASIYFHIDYKIGHYIKVIMDEIFGIKNFRNDISRIKCNPKNFERKGYSNVKDMILFYTKSNHFIWNEPRQPMSEEDIERLFPKIDAHGRRFTTNPLHAPGETANGRTGQEWKGKKPPSGRHWRYDPSVLDRLDAEGLVEWSSTGNPRKIIYADEVGARGKRLQDIWEFKDRQYPCYPTEKNIEMLKTIVRASSNEGSLVFDCFSGSGTTILSAQELGRNWIGIDNSKIAIETTLKRLKEFPPSLFHELSFAYYEECPAIASPEATQAV